MSQSVTIKICTVSLCIESEYGKLCTKKLGHLSGSAECQYFVISIFLKGIQSKKIRKKKRFDLELNFLTFKIGTVWWGPRTQESRTQDPGPGP